MSSVTRGRRLEYHKNVGRGAAAAGVRANSIALVESYILRMIDCINTRDWTNSIMDLIAPKMVSSTLDSFLPTITAEEHIDKYREMTKENPDYHTDVVDISTDLDVEGQIAKLFLTTHVVGRPSGLKGEVFAFFTWQTQMGGWLLLSHDSMRMAAVGW